MHFPLSNPKKCSFTQPENRPKLLCQANKGLDEGEKDDPEILAGLTQNPSLRRLGTQT